MDAIEYIEQVAKPMVDRLRSTPDAIDLQIAAVVVVFHATDYIAKTNNEKPSDVVVRVKQRFADFEIVHAAANANKHHTIDQSPRAYKGLSDPQKPARKRRVSFGGSRVTWNGQSVVWITPPHYERRDGRDVPILEVLEKSISALEQEV